MEANSRGRKKYWDHWQTYAAPVGVRAYLQDTKFSSQIRLLSRFAPVCTGYYGKGNQVKNCIVSSALMAAGQTIALACDSNPTKVMGSKHLLLQLQIMLDRYRKVNPPTWKKLPVQADVPELLVKTSYQTGSPQRQKANAVLSLIAFYYLLRIGEYTKNTKQTVQFIYEDVSFFKKNSQGQLQCLPHDTPELLIATADGATLTLDKKKNEWRGVCVHQEVTAIHAFAQCAH
jgi:hypothetical protein